MERDGETSGLLTKEEGFIEEWVKEIDQRDGEFVRIFELARLCTFTSACGNSFSFKVP